MVHEFLTGSAPVTTDVEAQPGTVSLAGRAVYFPQNAGAEGGRLKVYEVDPATGKRLSRQWLYTKLLDETGTFGPFDADGAASYEFELVRPNRPDARIAHFYPQPFLRSDHLIRCIEEVRLVRRISRHGMRTCAVGPTLSFQSLIGVAATSSRPVM